jgi:hypothetical protein
MVKRLDERSTKNENVRVSRRLISISGDLLDGIERLLAKSQSAVEASLSIVRREPIAEPS